MAVTASEAQARFGGWERYRAAAEGFREYWYPVMSSRRLRSRPVARRLCGIDLLLVRHQGRACAVEDRCPHRLVPLSMGKCIFPGHITCIYHGWTFDVTDGRLVAALTDGPDSPVVGRTRVRAFPVEERCGLVWVWTGDGEPVPVEEDIPSELLAPDARIYIRFSEVAGDWRNAVENGFDESHGKMLHRDSLWVTFRHVSGWTEPAIEVSEDGKWLQRRLVGARQTDRYPGLGEWPKRPFWKLRGRRKGMNARVWVRLPCTLGVMQPTAAGWSNYDWYMPQDGARYTYLQLAVAWRRGLWGRLVWGLRFWVYIRYVHHVLFNGQDIRMIRLMPASDPAPLFRPDISIIEWRNFAENARRPRQREGAGAVRQAS
jgi:phenylpropionate dioxygenase-like ring-hydroxylating dioxygenase large terminal subunit